MGKKTWVLKERMELLRKKRGGEKDENILRWKRWRWEKEKHSKD